MAKASDRETLRLHGPAGNLEAVLEIPPQTAVKAVAILCHPHPLHQGTMQNKVVYTLARAMNELGIIALRFNFRGVGGSDGVYADGEGEIEDVEAVADYVRERWPGAELWLAGFSFGAVVSARAAGMLLPTQLISIAPAVNILGRELTSPPAMPWLVVQGEKDDVVPAGEVVDWVNTLNPAPELVLLPEAGHFFHGCLVELRNILVNKLGPVTENNDRKS